MAKKDSLEAGRLEKGRPGEAAGGMSRRLGTRYLPFTGDLIPAPLAVLGPLALGAAGTNDPFLGLPNIEAPLDLDKRDSCVPR